MGAWDGGLLRQMLWGGALHPRPRGAVMMWPPFLLTLDVWGLLASMVCTGHKPSVLVLTTYFILED